MRENYLRAATFGYPEYIPYTINLSASTWVALGDELEKIVLRHPRTWPGYKPRNINWKEIPVRPHEDPSQDFVDSWGCVWRTIVRGMTGSVIKPALPDLADLATYQAPDLQSYNGGLYPNDWIEAKNRATRLHNEGKVAIGGLAHGFHMLRLEYLRGFENLMCDLMDATPEFLKLVNLVHERNKQAVKNWLTTGVDVIRLPEDLGGQTSSFLGPSLFSQWVTPFHKELHDLAHSQSVLTLFHCDGYIMDVADQIIAIGPDIFNPQDVCNGVDAIAEAFKGRMCIYLDFDRQNTMCFGSPQDVRELLEYEVRTLGQPAGGLMLNAGTWGEVPPDNIEALVSTMENLCTNWAK
jgi:hypothetical protein